ncbi:hypothetical protein DC522_30910 [Microvirga sp. KLBC 81]|nr:hypothetical protein DC522_30910 [Microvirga sp. KLBC 81]
MEQLLIWAYVRLIFMPMDSSGSRTAIVEQFCSPVERRGLIELDEEDVSKAVGFIVQVKQLGEVYH